MSRETMKLAPLSLEELIERARTLPPMTEWERELQRRSFVHGNCGIENPLVTRDVVDYVANGIPVVKALLRILSYA